MILFSLTDVLQQQRKKNILLHLVLQVRPYKQCKCAAVGTLKSDFASRAAAGQHPAVGEHPLHPLPEGPRSGQHSE